MTKINLSLRLKGELPPFSSLDETLGVSATKTYKKGELIGRKKTRVQPQDVWILDLTPNLDHGSSAEEIESAFLEAANSLIKVLPRLSILKNENFHREIYISLFQEEDQGGFSLPSVLVQTIALTNIPIVVSIVAI